MTVMRMATPRGPIPVTVDTFEASGGGGMQSTDAHMRKVYIYITEYIKWFAEYGDFTYVLGQQPSLGLRV